MQTRRILHLGPVGSGCVMAARKLHNELLQTTYLQKVEMAWINSASRLPEPADYNNFRPFRAPHHTVSQAGMVGNEKYLGEVSLAHGGTLLLDCLPEFTRQTIDALRYAILKGYKGSPCNPDILFCSANLCPCGYRGNGKMMCKCSPKQVGSYMSRVMDYAETLGLDEVITVQDLSSLKKSLGESVNLTSSHV